MSRNTGTAPKEQVPEVSRVAASIGKAAFFAPEAVSTPSRRFPPPDNQTVQKSPRSGGLRSDVDCVKGAVGNEP